MLNLNKNLELYHNPHEPTIFFGVYIKKDLEKILNHKSYGIIIFAGSDTDYNNKYFKSIRKDSRYILNKLTTIDKNRFKFVSISNYIYNDLKKYNLESIKNPFYFGETKKNPVKRGSLIYAYIPLNKKKFS